MKLVVISHKDVWADPDSPSGFATTGGFPQQMAALADLFDETTVLVPRLPGPAPKGLKPLAGRDLRIQTLDKLPERGWRRKAIMARWLPANLGRIWQAVGAAGAVHTPVPGDVGTIGILVALARRKPLFVRHCSLWGEKTTLVARFLLWLLERTAGERNVVMATGAANEPPSQKNAAIRWIFSTSLAEADWQNMPPHQNWRKGEPLRLVTVGRLEPVKNTAAILQALPLVQPFCPQVGLDVVGDGSCRESLRQLAGQLGIAKSVTFHGNVPQRRVLEIVAGCHIFLLPSFMEGFPKAALEAMACGLPVIATAVSALPYLVGAQNGVLLESPTAGAIAEAIRQLLADEDRLAGLSAGGRSTARQYTLERWRDTIGERLAASWGPLQEQSANGPLEASVPLAESSI